MDRNSPKHLCAMCALPYVTLFVLVIIVYGDALFTSRALVPSNGLYDARTYFIPVRGFAYQQIRQGHLPLWNPHAYSGYPSLAALQPALMYPFNCFYLVLPIAKAVTIEIILHVYLLGHFMYVWAQSRGLKRSGALLAAAVCMFSGPCVLNIMSGHLAYIDALAWSPLSFLAADKIIDGGKRRWSVIGALSLTMSILAGHPQAVYCTLVALLPYATARLWSATGRARLLFPLGLMFFAPFLLTAVQLWPAIAASGESVRAGGLHFILGSSMSLPPENLVTLLSPTVMGDAMRTTYWGRWAYWEVCLFVGIATVTLAVYAVSASRTRTRYLWIGIILIALVMAMGRYTPVYRLLYSVLPGMDSFRCPSRHAFQATMFLGLLAGLGLDTLAISPRPARRYSVIVFAIGVFLALCGCAVYWFASYGGPDTPWSNFLQAIHSESEAWWQYGDDLVEPTARNAAWSLIVAAVSCGLLAILYRLVNGHQWATKLIFAFCLFELLAFALMSRSTFDLDRMQRPRTAEKLHALPGDFRVFDKSTQNYPIEVGLKGIWGWDSFALLRYAQLMAYVEGTSAETELTEFSFKWTHPIFNMLRCQYIIDSRNDDNEIYRFGSALPRMLLLDRYRVIPDLEDRLAALSELTFNPREIVVLESEPSPVPELGGANGSIRYTDETTDSFVVEVELSKPALLLITDAYARDWHVHPLTPDKTEKYEIIPANHALQAIPLPAGHLRLRVQYLPFSYTIGMWVSLVSAGLCVIGGLFALRSTLSNHALKRNVDALNSV